MPRRDGGREAYGFYFVLRDLTELKQPEETFRECVETAPVALIIHDPQGHIALIPAADIQTCVPPERLLIGQPVEILMPERFRRTHVQKLKEYMEKPVPRPMGIGLV